MDKEKAQAIALGYTDEGFLCVEAVFKTLADMHGTESDLIPKVATGVCCRDSTDKQHLWGGYGCHTWAGALVWQERAS